MNIRLLDNYELRRLDDRNWRLYEYKAVEKRDKPRGKKTGEKVMEWVPLECFPRTICGAVEWILEYVPKRNWKDGECGLRDAVGALRGIERDMARHAKAFEKAARNG